MNKLFDKKIKVTIFPKKGGNGVVIKNLKIEFEIKKNDDNESNNATVTIYNMSSNTKKMISELDTEIVIDAGYSTTIGVIFVGDIINISHEVKGVDYKTTITAQDGNIALKTSKISVSYTNGTEAKKMIADIVKSIKLPLKIPIDKLKIPNVKTSNNESFIGSSKTLLTKITKKIGYNWFVEDGVLVLHKVNVSNDTQAILLSPNSGLVGSPEDIDLKINDKKNNGVKITTLLMAQVKINDNIVVKSKEYDNVIFRVLELLHIGDTHGNKWNTIIKAVTV